MGPRHNRESLPQPPARQRRPAVRGGYRNADQTEGSGVLDPDLPERNWRHHSYRRCSRASVASHYRTAGIPADLAKLPRADIPGAEDILGREGYDKRDLADGSPQGV